MSDTPSNELLDLYRKDGDEAAFHQLVDRHAGLVCAAASRRLGSRSHLAPDVVQFVFCSLARRANSLPRDVVLPAWLHAVAVRRSISMIRSEIRRERREREAAIDLTSDAGRGADEIAAELDDAIASLSRRDREVIVVRYLDDHDVAQTAQILGISYEAAKKRTARALDRLRIRLGRRGVATASAGLVAFLGSPQLRAAPASASKITVDFVMAQNGGRGAAGLLAKVTESTVNYPVFAVWGVGIASIVGLSIAASTPHPPRGGSSPTAIGKINRLSAIPMDQDLQRVSAAHSLEEMLALPVENLLAEMARLAMAPRTIKNQARLRLLISSVEPGKIGALVELAQDTLPLPPKYRLMRGLIGRYAELAPLAALDFIVESRVDVELNDQGFGILAYTLRHLWNSDRAACVGWLATNLNLPELEKGVEFISHSMISLALQSPAEALAIVERLPAGTNADRLRAALKPEAHYIDQSSDDWRSAVERIAGLSGSGAEEMLRSTVEVWAVMHDADVRAWIGSLDDPETRFSASLGVLAVERNILETRDEEGGITRTGTPVTDRTERAELVLRNAGDRSLDDTLEAIGGVWRPSEEALFWLLQAGADGLADRAVVKLAEAEADLERSAYQGRPSSAQKSMTYAGRIIDPELRAATIARLYLRWQQSNRDEAAHWLSMSNLPAADIEYLNVVKLP